MKSFFMGILLLVFITGCSTEIRKVVASEKNMPSNILDLKREPSESPNIDSLVIKVTNAEQLTEAWDYFSMEKKTPKADFDTYDYYFVSIRESSSCPYKLKDVTVNDSNKEINFYFREKAGSCNANATPQNGRG